MNYLAHLFLAEQTDDGLLGGLLGDFVKGRPDPALAAGVRRGIALHRRIDSYTDAHPVHLRSRRRFQGQRRRIAGIIVDVCYDHFLAREWDRRAPVPLERFCARVYRLLRAHEAVLPERLQAIAPRMASRDWLGSYRQVGAIGRVLDGIAGRSSRIAALEGALPEVMRSYADLAADFETFFPELEAHAALLREALAAAPAQATSDAGSVLAPHTSTPTRSRAAGR